MSYTSDYDDSLRFLRLIHPQATCFEVRVKRRRGAYGQLFDDVERAAAHAAEQSDQPETVAVWLTTNAVDTSTWTRGQKSAADANIIRRTAFFADFDAARPKNTNSTDAELEATRVAAVECIDYLTSLGFPQPVHIMSGNGHQVWYQIDLPADDGGLIERFLHALGAKFRGVDTSVHNPARLGRMPGTMNRKAPETPERPHRLSRIISAPLYLEVGTSFVDETFLVHVSGSVVKHAEQLVAPTTSIPMIPVLALFWEKCGVSRDHALRMLREAITEAMTTGKSKDEQIEARIKDVEKAVEAIRTSLISSLPKQKRAGRIITKDLEVEILPVEDGVLAAA